MDTAHGVAPTIVPVTKRTKESALSMLSGYTRVDGCKALKDLRNVDDLFVLVKRGERYFTVKGETVDDLLDQSEGSGESLCNVLLKDFFGLSDSQYRRIRKEFTKAGSYGVYVNKQDSSKFGIFVDVPGQDAWYRDKRVRNSALATFAATTSLGLAGIGALMVGRERSMDLGPFADGDSTQLSFRNANYQDFSSVYDTADGY